MSLRSPAGQVSLDVVAAPVLPALVCAAVAYQLSVSIINPLLLDIAREFRISLALAAQSRTIQAAAAAATALAAIFVADRIPKRNQQHTLYTPSEVERISRICRDKHFHLLSDLGVDERNGDRLLLVFRTPQALDRSVGLAA